MSSSSAPLQKNKQFPPVPKHCVVTGSSGFVGQRLVEMLLERGAGRVVAMDILPTPRDAVVDARVEYVHGDIRDKALVDQVCRGADCVWHNAAAVGEKRIHSRVQLFQ
jgi:sterol-4alpha-carboxylate 3-dehydrogenase (decarboxylating)